MTHSLSLAMWWYSIQSRTRKCGYGFLSFARKYKKQLLDIGLDYLKTTSQKLVQKKNKTQPNKIANAVARTSNNDKIVKQEPVE